MSTLTDLPLDIFSRIFPGLGLYEVYSCVRVSKGMRNALVQFTTTVPQDDRTIKNAHELLWLKGDLSGLALYKFKMKILADQPQLFERFADVKKLLKSHPTYPCPIETYLKLANRASVVGLAASIVPFDFFTKRIPGAGPHGLGWILKDAIKIKNLGLVRAIFVHPNASKIVPNNFDGLSDALLAAVKADDPKIVWEIATSPKGAQISLTEVFGIIKCLHCAIAKGNAEIVKILLSLPQSKNIPAKASHNSLGHFLEAAISVRQPLMVKEIFSHPNGPKIPMDGAYGLQKALKFAKLINCAELINLILSHPNAKELAAL